MEPYILTCRPIPTNQQFSTRTYDHACRREMIIFRRNLQNINILFLITLFHVVLVILSVWGHQGIVIDHRCIALESKTHTIMSP